MTVSKGQDTFAPMGPYLQQTDEIEKSTSLEFIVRMVLRSKIQIQNFIIQHNDLTRI
jgi:2-keto-4-pentenoate hydratase/2-oxohepta-3-ene-1,7-dioic acid hydratase in catechol pathway